VNRLDLAMMETEKFLGRRCHRTAKENRLPIMPPHQIVEDRA
jgi:hypothetical protein